MGEMGGVVSAAKKVVKSAKNVTKKDPSEKAWFDLKKLLNDKDVKEVVLDDYLVFDTSSHQIIQDYKFGAEMWPFTGKTGKIKLKLKEILDSDHYDKPFLELDFTAPGELKITKQHNLYFIDKEYKSGRIQRYDRPLHLGERDFGLQSDTSEYYLPNSTEIAGQSLLRKYLR